jgi:hypothetical protein
LDPTNGTGLQNSSDPFSTPVEIERDQSSITTAAPHGQCDSGVAQQSSNQAGPTSSGSVCVNFNSSGEREQFWPVSSRHKPSCLEPICGTSAIQNGESPSCENGSERCVSYCPHPSGPLPLSSILLPRESVRVSLPTLRTLVCPSGIYKDLETSSCLDSFSGNSHFWTISCFYIRTRTT